MLFSKAQYFTSHRPGVLSEVLTLLVLMYPLLRGLAVHLHSAVTGSYIPGTHSIAFVTCLNEQIARDIARYGDTSLAALLEGFRSWNKAECSLLPLYFAFL